MKRIFFIFFLAVISVSGVIGQDLKSQIILEGSGGISKINNTPGNNKYFRIDYAALVPGSKFNWGTKYFFGVTNQKPILYDVYDPYSYDYFLGSGIESKEISVRYVTYGMGAFLNRYLIGNYFDGGLYANVELTAGLTHVRGNIRTTSTRFTQDTVTKLEDFSYLEAMDLIMFNGGVQIGYSIPLSKYNLGVFAKFGHSIWGIDFFGEYGDEQVTTLKEMVISFGLNLQLFRDY